MDLARHSNGSSTGANNNNNIDERDSNSQMSDAEKAGPMSATSDNLPIDTQLTSYGGGYQYGQSGDFRRPLTVIF